MKVLESLHHPLVKTWSKLLRKKGREQQQAYLIEGEHLIEEALESGVRLEAILFQQDREIPPAIQKRLHDQRVLYAASERVIERLSDTRTPQGIVAVVHRPDPDRLSIQMEEVLSRDRFFLLLLDRIQDPGNLGTMIRTADAAGLDGVVLGNGTVDLYNPKTVRASMGSLFHIPVVSGNLSEWIGRIREKGGTVLGTSLDEAVPYSDPVFTEQSAIIIGNEGQGVDPEILQQADVRVKIPIYGRAESLNAAAATAVLLYEGVRQIRS
ncbi:MAG: RNA methyltransferase [Bacillaceae bacterium]|nr:RNA methyltransferase [Bacillaceae bacterium]